MIMASTKESKPFKLEETEDGRLFSPSTERNQGAIKDVFLKEIPSNARVLEIASGSGQHSVHIMQDQPAMRWVASDISQEARASVRAWAEHAGLSDQYEDIRSIDASSEDWRIDGKFDAILSSNMIHISPWEVGLGLMAGAHKYLKAGGRLFLYGPFKRDGEHIAESNVSFDANLQNKDASWGVRDLEGDVIPAAQKAGLSLVRVHAMPANNFSVIFERT